MSDTTEQIQESGSSGELQAPEGLGHLRELAEQSTFAAETFTDPAAQQVAYARSVLGLALAKPNAEQQLTSLHRARNSLAEVCKAWEVTGRNVMKAGRPVITEAYLLLADTHILAIKAGDRYTPHIGRAINLCYIRAHRYIGTSVGRMQVCESAAIGWTALGNTGEARSWRIQGSADDKVLAFLAAMAFHIPRLLQSDMQSISDFRQQARKVSETDDLSPETALEMIKEKYRGSANSAG